MSQPPASTASEAAGSAARPGRPERGAGLFERLSIFLREVVAELRKVVYPTRQQVLTYTAVVLVFVIVIMTYVSALDFAFGRLVLWAFGG
jgi:preprotein translocase subunit SecE